MDAASTFGQRESASYRDDGAGAPTLRRRALRASLRGEGVDTAGAFLRTDPRRTTCHRCAHAAGARPSPAVPVGPSTVFDPDAIGRKPAAFGAMNETKKQKKSDDRLRATARLRRRVRSDDRADNILRVCKETRKTRTRCPSFLRFAFPPERGRGGLGRRGAPTVAWRRGRARGGEEQRYRAGCDSAPPPCRLPGAERRRTPRATVRVRSRCP